MHVKNYFSPELAHVDEMIVDISQKGNNQNWYGYCIVTVFSSFNLEVRSEHRVSEIQNTIIRTKIPYF